MIAWIALFLPVGSGYTPWLAFKPNGVKIFREPHSNLARAFSLDPGQGIHFAEVKR
jgi:hypothetical protein